MSTAIVWFRRDLRLADNPALAAALKTHDAIVCAYVHAPDEEAPWAPGAASRWWLHHSLQALDADLGRRGARLHLRVGPAITALDALVRESSADAVYWNRLYEPALARRDRAVQRHLEGAGVDVQTFNANLLVEPWQIETGNGGPYRVFTPFWRNVRAHLDARPTTAALRRIDESPVRGGVTLESLHLLPTIAWDGGLRTAWRPGERGAQVRLRQFTASALAGYKDGRDRPDCDFTSRLSPHLHFGEVGPRQILWTLAEVRATGGALQHDGTESFLRELGWREFSHHLLHHFPQTPGRNLDARFDAFPWARRNAQALVRWQSGETGIPIVDAGMRQLWKTGWMHNRVRMLVASFLTKNLRQHWLHGARWFWDTLVDANLANNTQGWQWTAGSGADAAPYFRVFNPVMQARRFDPDGAYIRRWVPELRRVAAPLIHEPWTDLDTLRRAHYPAPIVDLAASRCAALAAYAAMKARTPAVTAKRGQPGRQAP
jgi:deoxyribodipyrimidine photo-lyase